MRADVGRFEHARAVRAKSEAAVIGGIAENESRRLAANFAASQTVANQETADAASLSLGPRGDRPERQRGKWRDILKIRRSRRFSRHDRRQREDHMPARRSSSTNSASVAVGNAASKTARIAARRMGIQGGRPCDVS